MTSCKSRTSATGGLLAGRGYGLGFNEATAFPLFPAQQRIDHGRSTTDAGLHGNGFEGAIPAAGAAFHAGVPIPDGNTLPV
jgi:hypothetical protein